MKNNIFERVLLKLRAMVLPTERDKVIAQWRADKGDEVLRVEYDLGNDSVVCDLGGYKGQWSSDIYSRYNCRIFVFEPVIGFAKNIKERFEKNPNIKVFPFALGASKRIETISLCDDASSFMRKGNSTTTIQVEDIAEILSVVLSNECDLMKINIEGAEYEVMQRLIETDWIKKIKNIQIQFHDVGPDSEQRMKSIWQELEKTHKITYQYKFVWENWQRNK